MADFNFPGIDLSHHFLPPSSSISVYRPFRYSPPRLAVKPPHDYGTFTYPFTPEDEQPRPLSLPLRPRDFSLNSTPSLSFSRSSSISSKASSSSSTFDVESNRLSNTQWEPLTSFPYFTSLPLEIQRTIWRHTLPGPQIIEIHQYAPSTPRSSSPIQVTKQQDQEPLPILKTHTPFPIALHINHLSRRLALSHLTPLSFAQPYYLPSNPYAYINYHHDTIYLTSRTLYPDLGNHILYSRNLHKIRNLALEFTAWSALLRDNHFVNALLEMEGLLRIDIIFERDLSSFSSHHTSISDNDASSMVRISKPPQESTYPINRRNNHYYQNTHHHHHHHHQIAFLEPTKQETKNLEDLFERESEKIWLWGRVSGWEDVRGKLRFKIKQEGKNEKPKSAIQLLEKNENESFTRSYPKSKSRYSANRSRNPQSENWEIPSLRRRAGVKESLEEELESLIHSVDDAMLDFGDVARGAGDRGACDWFVDGLLRDRDMNGDVDVDVDVEGDVDVNIDGEGDVYSESEYSRCSGDLDDHDHGNGDDDEDEDEDEVGGWI